MRATGVMRRGVWGVFFGLLLVAGTNAAGAVEAAAALILHNGRIVTVDIAFSIVQAVAVREGRIVVVGSNDAALALKGAGTEVIDLKGRTMIPGLIDSHVHPAAAMTEFDHALPEMESVEDILDYVKKRAAVVGEGKWIAVRQVFITRLREPRYPTRAELDAAAPNNPVLFATGPDCSLNSLAMKLSGIDRDFKVSDGGPGYAERDAAGELTGILRSATRYVKVEESGRKASEEETYRRTVELFRDYNSVGLTTVGDRSATPASLDRYKKMLDHGELSVRLAASYHVDHIGTLESIQNRVRAAAAHPLRKPDPMLHVIGIKMFLDGGMLTGSAYMREPWGVSKTYGITDPNYRGVLFIPRERLLPIVRTTIESGLQFTAHSVGDGAVHTLLSVYDEINKTTPVAPVRPCITHSNFMSREAIDEIVRLGVVVDMQPVWLYLDTRTLVQQFGYDRLRYFQPLHSLFEAGAIAGGGSDHMQKIGSLRSINPYNPFLGMATAITRTARWYDKPLHLEEAISREQALRFYTINNAHLLFKENEVGSIEAGKFADLAVLDRDLLTCPVEQIRETQVLAIYLAGRRVFERP
ncbi:MAG: nfdA 3 [Phycisphaerales bacterium]|nr:nfdA 3 [Phycisphaerales bacterium]